MGRNVRFAGCTLNVVALLRSAEFMNAADGRVIHDRMKVIEVKAIVEKVRV
jgi:hypothetical protein